jgi:uncharacterized protein
MINRRIAPRFGELIVALVLLLAWQGSLFAQVEKDIPPAPTRYVTDYVGLLDNSSIESINSQLEQFEKDTSNQILVVIYAALPADAELAQFCTQTAQAWGVGQKGKDNGVVLFIFARDGKMFISTGRGMEGALPDATCKNIVTQIIIPRFKLRDYSGGIQAGLNAMIAATKGEYQGNGSTVADGKGADQGVPWVAIIIFLIIFILISRYGSSLGGRSGPVIFTGGGFGGGGGYGGGGGGGGGFSGGGGSSAGGGAGGSW